MLAKFIAAVLILFVTAAQAVVPTVSATSAWVRGTTNPLTLNAMAVTAGDMVAVCVFGNWGADVSGTLTVTEGGRTYTLAGTAHAYEGNGNRYNALYYYLNHPGGASIAPVITKTAPTEVEGSAYSVSGIATTAALDRSNNQNPTTNWGNQNNPAAALSAGGTNAIANEIAISCIGGKSDVQFGAGTVKATGYTAIQQTGNASGNSPAGSAYKIESTLVTSSITWDSHQTTVNNDFSNYGASVIATFIGLTSGPNISGPSASEVQGSSIHIFGSNFGLTKGTGHVDCGLTGHTTVQMTTVWSDTDITLTVDKGHTNYGVTWPCSVTNDAGLTSATPWNGITSLTPPSGKSYVNATTPYATLNKRITTCVFSGNSCTSGTDLSSGDQCEYDNATAVLNANMTWNETVAGFPWSAACWNAAAFNWGSAGVQSFTAPVVTGNPAAFGFFGP